MFCLHFSGVGISYPSYPENCKAVNSLMEEDYDIFFYWPMCCLLTHDGRIIIFFFYLRHSLSFRVFTKCTWKKRQKWFRSIYLHKRVMQISWKKMAKWIWEYLFAYIQTCEATFVFVTQHTGTSVFIFPQLLKITVISCCSCHLVCQIFTKE